MTSFSPASLRTILSLAQQQQRPAEPAKKPPPLPPRAGQASPPRAAAPSSPTLLDALPPTVKEAEILLTPNPQAVEHIASITRIWGKPVVFPHVALSRQDLSNTAQGAH